MLEALFISNLITLLLGLLMASVASRRESFILVSILAISIQSVAIGVRNPGMMTDTREYAALFYGTSGFEERIEPLFMMLVYAFRQVSDSVSVFLTGLSALMNFVYFFALYILLGRYALLVFGLFSSTFSYWLIHVQVIRSGLASILLLLGLTLILNKRFRRGLIPFALALGVHFSIAIISVGAFLGYTLAEFKIRRFLAVSALTAGAYAVYEYALPNLPSLAPWKSRLDAYAYYNENLFVASSFGYTYIFFVLISVGFAFFWKRQQKTEKVLFFVYLSVAALSFLFWSNILFRDRVFIFAQIIEPILISKLIMNSLGRRAGAFVVFGVSIPASLFVLYVWGPRTVLVF